MSFSHKVKDELARIQEDVINVQRAELASLLRTCGTIQIHGYEGMTVKVASENATIIKRIYVLLKTVFDIKNEVYVKENKHLTKHNLYFIIINRENSLKVLAECGIISIDDNSWNINDDIAPFIIADMKQKRAYLRGVFLGCGSISDPEKGYHLEMVVHDREYAFSIKSLINFFDLDAKIIARKNNYVVYLKEGEQIVDFLNIIGAYKSLLDFENVRVIKDVRNNVNRVVNCETANLSKTVNASIRQIENIEYIDKTIGLNKLPKDLYEVAYVRLNNRDLSLKELGQLLNPPLGKSGVNHRLKRIEYIAYKIKEKRGDVINVQKDNNSEK